MPAAAKKKPTRKQQQTATLALYTAIDGLLDAGISLSDIDELAASYTNEIYSNWKDAQTPAEKAISDWRFNCDAAIATHPAKVKATMKARLNRAQALIRQRMTATEKRIGQKLDGGQARRICSHYAFFPAEAA